MDHSLNMCITAHQALKFKELGVNQSESHLYWGFQKAENSLSGDKGYYHLLFFKNENNELIFLCSERNYGCDTYNFSRPIEYAAAYTADILATMLDIHLKDIEYNESDQLIDQNTNQVIPYSKYVHAMADRIIIALTIGEFTSRQIDDLL